MAVILLSAVSSWAGWHDPMRPQVETSVAALTEAVDAALHLEATFVSRQRCIAVIDGETVAIGDRLRGYRVKTITADGVVLTGRAGRKQLRLQPSIVSWLSEYKTSGVD